MGDIYTLHFFLIQGLKRKKTPLSKGSKNLTQEQFMETFFWDTWGCSDSEKLKNIAVRTFVPPIFYYDQTSILTYYYTKSVAL